MDLINKQEALRLLKLNYDDSPGDTEDLMYNDGVRSCIKTVREMKAITGEWINEERVGFGSLEAQCSCCGRRMIYKPQWKFCPWCGAAMAGEGDG